MKNRDKLLAELAFRLHRYDEVKISSICVRLYLGDQMLKEFSGLTSALDHLVGNLYWDETGNWSEADRLLIYTY